jgi:hypothetical protein
MDAGAKSRFEKAADVLEVDPATREIMWRRIADLQLSPDDPTVLFLAVAGILEKAATDIPEAVLSIPGTAMEAVAPATAAAIVAAQSKVAAEIEKIVEDTKGEVRKQRRRPCMSSPAVKRGGGIF